MGYDYHGPAENCAWGEDAFYVLDEADVAALVSATSELHLRCLDVVNAVCRDDALMARFGVPENMRAGVRRSWEERHANPHLLGRLDLAYDPATRATKLIEYNADTPTTAIETAVIQWKWLEATRPGADQFNSLHERIPERLAELRDTGRLRKGRFALAPYPNSLEDFRHCEYYAELAAQAGIRADIVTLEEIGVTASGHLVDGADRPIDVLLKIYPWEMIAKDRYAPLMVSGAVQTLEPPWKMLLSNKAILPTLSRMFPGHPHLLRAAWEPEGMRSFVSKPIFSRGGENVEVVLGGRVTTRTEGTYGAYPRIYQDFAEFPRFGDQQAQIGSWLVGDEPAGVIIREAPVGSVVVDRSRCVPHLIG